MARRNSRTCQRCNGAAAVATIHDEKGIWPDGIGGVFCRSCARTVLTHGFLDGCDLGGQDRAALILRAHRAADSVLMGGAA